MVYNSSGMGRKPRIEYEGAVYHVSARAVGPRALYADNSDRIHFLNLLRRTRRKYSWDFLAFCLMTTHYHAVLRTARPNLSRGMAWLNGSYARRFNLRQDRSGHLFDKRFFSRLVRSEAHLCEEIRYVLLNPVRAGMVSDPADYRWSSCSACLGLRSAGSFGIVDVDEVLGVFAQSAEAGSKRLRSFLEAGMDGEISPPEVPDDLPADFSLGSGTDGSGSAPTSFPLRRETYGSNLEERNRAIRRACLQLGLSQKTVADRLGLSPSLVSKVLSRSS